MNQPIEATDTAKIQIKILQQEWLENTITQMFLKALSNRQGEYKRRLLDRCLKLTDVNADIQDRACISTCDAIHKIITDPDLFVRYSTLKPNN
jgi:hypothetical protein